MSVTGAASEREAEVLAALGDGLSNAQIASRLYISVRTVESHVSSLLRKYGVADRRALAGFAEQPPTGAPRRLAGLPVARSTFVGRAHERDTVLGLLGSARLVTLVGPGGVGKTRLATVVAEAAAGSFPSGGAFVDLVPVRGGFVVQAVAAVLGVTERPQQQLSDAVLDRLRGGRGLLVLDNCEHLLDAAADFIEQVLTGCPETTVLATGRERLGLPGERVLPVGPLPLDSDAELLFRDRATAGDPDFAAPPAVVAQVCSRLDGMPLAIELAAARSRSLGIDGLRAALDDHLRVLVGGRGPDDRHRSMRAVIAWSYDLLDERERALLRALAVFAGEFDLAAVVDVVAGDGRAAVADVLGRLVDKSMVVRGDSGWRLLETVRAFGLDRLAETGGTAELVARHLRWAAARAATLEDQLASGSWRDGFDAVADDLRAALAGVPAGPDAVAHRLARSLGRLCYARRFLMESLGHYQDAARRAVSPRDAASDLRSAADCAHSITHAGHAYELLLASAERAGVAEAGNARAVALAYAVVTAQRLAGSGFPARIPGERLRVLLDQARTAGDPGDPVVAAQLAAATAWTGADPPPDPALARTAADLARSTGDPVLISAGLDALTTVAATAGHLREAHRLSTERLTLLSVMDRTDPYPAVEIVDALHVASVFAVAVGDLPAALRLARQAMSDDLIGDHPYMSTSKLIPPLVLTGSFDEALEHATTMWDGWTRAGGPAAKWMSPAVCAVALAHGLLGDEEGFRRWRARAVRVAGVAEPERSRNLASFAALSDARVAVHTGDVSDAPGIVARAFADFPPGRFEHYARAAGAELAVLAGLPDAAERVAAAWATAGENAWSVACLARAAGRLHGDNDQLRAAAAGWEAIGAHFEAASTTALITPGRHA